MAMTLCTGLSSCSENDGVVEEYPDWQNTNQNYFSNAIAQARQQVAQGSTEWKVLRSMSLNADVATSDNHYVVVQVLKEGTGSGCPLYTDSVKVNFRARLLPSVSYPQGYVFAQSYDTEELDPESAVPATLPVAQSTSTTNGLSTVLQQMHIGDRWKATVPYTLGYGEVQMSSPVVAPFSTLIYDVQLVAYYRSPSPLSAPAKNAANSNDSQPKGYWVYE